MTLNMGNVDRVLRAVLGVAAVVIVALGLVTSPWTWVLIGFAVSRDSDKPRVAFYNEIEAEQSEEGLDLGGGGFNQEQAFDRLCERVECVNASSREDAIRKVEEGEVLAALILPEDFLDKLENQLGGAGLDPAEVEVYVNEDDPVKAGLVDDRITAGCSA